MHCHVLSEMLKGGLLLHVLTFQYMQDFLKFSCNYNASLFLLQNIDIQTFILDMCFYFHDGASSCERHCFDINVSREILCIYFI